ncbi:hypothetical protein [Paenibacillus aceti]|uniref:DUF5668 domain-containing protein n=1 Tax=Paenibacillus aceti TaxID=1820010 RepID=A0ABQ1VPZ0_9BACL|nr:hypothetical protein [Paenibacillus aceti]GGF82958.1 hypothetical protein GCM10010913_00530 [Paenibacillus aceti]
MSANNKLTTGILILSAGIIILLGKLGVFSFLGRALWPLLLLIPGILLHMWYFWRKGPVELLVPGGILVVYSLIFFIGNFGGWQTLKYIWPAFLLGIAVGLFEYDFCSPKRQQGVFAGALVIGILSVALLGWTLFTWSVLYLLAIVLIIAGIVLIVTRGKTRRGW